MSPVYFPHFPYFRVLPRNPRSRLAVQRAFEIFGIRDERNFLTMRVVMFSVGMVLCICRCILAFEKPNRGLNFWTH